MRAPLLVLFLVGCGPVRLGDEGADDVRLDAGELRFDAGPSAPEAIITVLASGGCEACFDIAVEGTGGLPPYTFEWQDGLREATRTLCPATMDGTLTVSVRDANAQRSAPQLLQLESSDASCPAPAPLLCLQNPSFEGTPAANTGTPSMFDAPPWSNCSNPSFANIPDIVNNSVQTPIAVAPQPTDGNTYLGLPEDSQTSERLCQSLTGSSTVSVRLDLQRLPVNNGVAPETEAAFLEIWGGVAADCSLRELLWASPPLSLGWQNYCATLSPQQFTDNLVLRANSDGSLPTTVVVLVDHLVPVSHCPP